MESVLGLGNDELDHAVEGAVAAVDEARLVLGAKKYKVGGAGDRPA